MGLRLVGAGKNRDAVGALVRLTVGARTWVRQVHAASGYLSQSSLTLHFGLGAASRVDSLEVRFPDGATRILRDVVADRRIVVEEE